MSFTHTKGIRRDNRERMEKRQDEQGWHIRADGVRVHRTPADQLDYLNANGFRAVKERGKIAKKLKSTP